MTDEINHDAALAGALVGLELFDSSPGAPKHELLSQLTFIILHSIGEATRLTDQARRDAGLHLSREMVDFALAEFAPGDPATDDLCRQLAMKGLAGIDEMIGPHNRVFALRELFAAARDVTKETRPRFEEVRHAPEPSVN